MSRFRRWWLLLFAWCALPFSAGAHQLDEYLQATLVFIEPREIKLEINLTPGVAIAEHILTIIDQNRDGVIATNEAAAYGNLLQRDLSARLDGNKVELKLTEIIFPPSAELRSGTGIIQVELLTPVEFLASGAHRFSLTNQHLAGTSVYLFNAALPQSAEIRIVRQQRNEIQSEGEIEFVRQQPANNFRNWGIGMAMVALLMVVAVGAKRAMSK